jgi:alpha-galactosidase
MRTQTRLKPQNVHRHSKTQTAAQILRRSLQAGVLTGAMAWLAAQTAQAVVTVAPAELAQKDGWVRANFLSPESTPPFSFLYDSQASPAFLHAWNRARIDSVLDGNRTQHVLTWTNASSDLQVKCVAVEYGDFPVVEWTVYFKDIGQGSTPILENLQALDINFSRGNGPEFVLNGNHGDYCTADSYEPYQMTLGPSTTTNFSPAGSGKSCDGPAGWPYYNLQMPGGGVILAIGWPGQWASSFTRDAGDNLRLQAGQQLTHLILNPGEEIRTPRILLFFWQGTNLARAQNLWRHWYLAHEIPRLHGQPPSPFMAIGDDSMNEVNAYLDAGMKPEVLWRDADTKPYDWYPTAGGPAKGNEAWFNTGTWEVDTNNYPNGFLPLSTAVHNIGMKFLLWFEPERVGNPNSWLATNHPEWLLTGIQSTGGRILNEGNPVALNWLSNHIDGMIKSNGLDWYREDMNGGGPCPAWRNNDATNRQGITENFYVQGHLAYWDALRAMNPGLRIDSCASGGRRNDLETMRRAVPLWRSDYVEVVDSTNLADANQCFTYGLSSWLPFQGTACGGVWNTYTFRSSYVTAFDNGGINSTNAAAQHQAWMEWKQLGPIMLNGDFYTLTPFSLTNTVWMAWQFDWSETGQGYVQAFRRRHGDDSSQTLLLKGLDPAAQYDLKNLDVEGSTQMSGADLMDKGLTIQIQDKPGSAVVVYKKM